LWLNRIAWLGARRSPGIKRLKTLAVDVETEAMRKISWRLIPFIALLYFAAFIDRVNVGFAAPQMNRDLGFSPYVYGLGAGIFFLSYCLFEVPSNLALHRIGGRLWIGRIMITWSVLAGAMAFIRTPFSFYALRFLLGAAEAGFFPGIVYYLTGWAPAAHRARLIGLFMTAIPLSTACGAPISSAILSLNGVFGVAGWRWLFLLETIPSLALGCATLIWLHDRPEQARWLTPAEKAWLTRTLEAERANRPAHAGALLRALTHPRVLALGLCYFGAEIGLYGVILWLPQILQNLGVSAANTGWAIAGPYAIAAVVMVLWCRHSDRTRERVWHIAIASAAGFAGLAASAYAPHSAALSLAAITLGVVGTIAILPIFWTLPTALLEGAAAAAGIALINALGNIGGFVGPFAVGWIRDRTGSYAPALLVVAGCVLLTGIVALILGHDSRAEYADSEASAAPPPLAAKA
jgi:ACS family tartrate transporter-like MFS transporter